MPRSEPHIIHCQLDISFVTRFVLPVRKCRLQLLLRLANCGSLRHGHRSRGDARVFRWNRKGTLETAINRKYGGSVHSRFAGQELDLICNHKLV